MIEFLIELDRILFILINVYLANPVTDFIMPYITADDFLRVVFAIIIILMLWRGDKRVRWLVLFAGLTLLATDQLSSNLLKHLIERIRPCHSFAEINLLVPCGGGYSMPSSHAANVFGQAVLLSNHIKKIIWPMMIFAVLVSLSRVFVGVHYPADIIFGAVVGITVALILSWIFRKFELLVIGPPHPEDAESVEEIKADASDEYSSEKDSSDADSSVTDSSDTNSSDTDENKAGQPDKE
jgi:undecaprenyl-diphosphatase